MSVGRYADVVLDLLTTDRDFGRTFASKGER
jgi:hypothetical protein